MQPKSEQKRTVFIVEDDAFLMKAYAMRFAQEGIDTAIAVNGPDALTLLTQKPPDAVILDILLPGLSGFDVLEKIKQADGWAKVPVIIVSNLSQEANIIRGQQLGAAKYVVKADTRIDDVISLTTSHFS